MTKKLKKGENHKIISIEFLNVNRNLFINAFLFVDFIPWVD